MNIGWRSARPQQGEADPYFFRYIDKVPDGDIVDVLSRQVAESVAFLRAIPESKGGHTYGPDKWTIREVIGHMTDAERVMGYRALRFSRNDDTPIEGFDENLYAANAASDLRSLGDLIDEFEHLRRSSIGLVNGLTQEMMSRRGNANGKDVTVRALAFIIAGHETHHMEILKTRYL